VDQNFRNPDLMWVPADETREQVIDGYRNACGHADETIAAFGLDAVGHVPWWGARSCRVEGFWTSLGLAATITRQTHKTEDLTNYVSDWSCRVDQDSPIWDVFLGPVESDDEITLGWLRPPLVLRALVEPPTQGFEINVADEHLIEQIDELREVARASAEERDGLLAVCD
jgi:hypothetical protein